MTWVKRAGSRGKPTVVLIHGLGRSHRCFRRLRRRLEAEGYRTWSRSYPSTRMTTGRAAAWLRERILAEVGPGPIYGITHSLGGIIARHLADSLPWEALVMLAPPNSGSRLARAASRGPILDLFCGPAGRELSSELLPLDWPAPPKPFGVIAGTRPSLSERAHTAMARLTGAFSATDRHDGAIAVDETVHPEMADFTTVDAGHNFMMDNPEVHMLVLRFLRQHTFGRGTLQRLLPGAHPG